MQQYAKYFRPEQKVQIRLVNPEDGHLESLTLFFVNHAPKHFDLALPYKLREGEEFPFAPGMVMELTTESLGIGVRMSVAFIEYAVINEIIRVRCIDDLKVFQRRTQRRVDIVAGIRFTRGQGTLRTFRNQWLKNISILEKTPISALPPFPTLPLNLSSTGMRLAIKPPLNRADLFLVLIHLKPEEKPICALCEVVWVGSTPDADGLVPCGMQFIALTDIDRKRIENHVKNFIPS